MSDIQRALDYMEYLRDSKGKGNFCHSLPDINNVISMLEKQIPKKPEKKPDKYCDLIQIYYCPTCGRYFGQRGVHDAILFNKERFCQGENCGQAIDWTKE